MLKAIAEKIKDQRIIKMINSFLDVTLFQDMSFSSIEEGVCQGSVLAPLFSNIYLLPLDRLMTDSGYNYLRYSDDMIILAANKATLVECKKVLERGLSDLKLNLNHEKTFIKHAAEGFEFLGYHFDLNGRGPAAKAVDALIANLRMISSRGGDLDARLEAGEAALRGWISYYGDVTWLTPDNLLMMTALLRLAAAQKNRKWAEHLLQIRSSVKEYDAQLCLRLGQAWARLGLIEEALREIGRILDTTGESSQVMDLLSSLLPNTDRQRPEICRQLRLLVKEPQSSEVYYQLAELLLQAGSYKLAQSMQDKAVMLGNHSPTYDLEDGNALPAADAYPLSEDNTFDSIDIELFLQLFAGKEDVFAYEVIGQGSSRGFINVHSPLTQIELKKHFNAEIALAVYPLRENNTVRFMVIDIDVSKKVLKEYEAQPDMLAAMIDRAQQDANRIWAAAENLGLLVAVEDSGHRGRHCWFFFEAPIKADLALRLARVILRKAGQVESGLTREVFPSGDDIDIGQPNSHIKLPFGMHPITGRRTLFVDNTGEPYPDQNEYLNSIELNSVERVYNILTVEDARSDAAIPSLTAVKEIREKRSLLVEELSPQLVRQVLRRCILLRYLVMQAEETKYLTHQDRLSLLFVLGFLGEEGKTYLHRVMSCCLNYNRLTTQKFIDRLLERPISCNRLRQKHQELTAAMGCDCRFKLLPGTYPSPVLHALRSDSRKQRAEVVLPTSETEKQVEIGVSPEAIVKKIQGLRKNQRGIESSIERYEKQLMDLFDAKQADRLPIEGGVLVRVKQSDGIYKWYIEL